MYNDPEEYFGNKNRKVSSLYKQHAIGRLKKDFNHTLSTHITKVFEKNGGLYYPSFKELLATSSKNSTKTRRKTKRADHECSIPEEIDLNFLKVSQCIPIQ